MILQYFEYAYVFTNYSELESGDADGVYEYAIKPNLHEFATTLNDLGIPADYIQKLGGWATDNVMKSVYTHTTSAKDAEYQKKIDEYFMSIISRKAV